MYKKSNSYASPYAAKKKSFSFRDLEVYQKTMSSSVIIIKDLSPKLSKLGYSFLDNMVNCSMSIPLMVGESHSVRYADFAVGVGLLEKAMAGCNKMIIYLEQIKGIYGDKIDTGLIDDVTNRYVDSRVKMFRLERSWRKYREDNPVPKAPVFKY